MKKIIVSILGIFIGIFHIHGQSKKIVKVDSLFTEMTHQNLFSGAILIADSSKILIAKGYGYADRENKIKNTANTRFDLSSGSKIFTGTAIAYLAQLGKIKFTDTVGQYINGLPKGNIITIHQVLTHSAGFDDFWKAKNFSYRNVKTCTDIIPFMRQLPLVYNPGDSCVYSTGDLIVLGAIIEKITGKSYQDYITELFIKPLNLTNTCFTPYWTLDESQRKYAIGYRKIDSLGYKKNAYDYDYGFVPLSAGGAWSSVLDLYRFDKAVFSDKIVNNQYFTKMTAKYTPQWESSHFGYIWINTDKGAYSSIGHPGISSGWKTINEYYPKQKYTIVILTNLGSVDTFSLLEKVEKIIFNTD